MNDSAEPLLARLEALGIATTTVSHPPLHTVAESRVLRGAIPGAHTKNLFLIDRNAACWLVVAEEQTRVDLKALARRLGAGRFSFGKPELLRASLGVNPGAVTPFALINDPADRVRLVLDQGLLAHERLNFHPLTNEATTSIGRDDFLRFLEAIAHPPLVLALDQPPDPS